MVAASAVQGAESAAGRGTLDVALGTTVAVTVATGLVAPTIGGGVPTVESVGAGAPWQAHALAAVTSATAAAFAWSLHGCGS